MCFFGLPFFFWSGRTNGKGAELIECTHKEKGNRECQYCPSDPLSLLLLPRCLIYIRGLARFTPSPANRGLGLGRLACRFRQTANASPLRGCLRGCFNRPLPLRVASLICLHMPLGSGSRIGREWFRVVGGRHICQARARFPSFSFSRSRTEEDRHFAMCCVCGLAFPPGEGSESRTSWLGREGAG